MTTLSDVLNATKPPLELLDHLTRYQGCAALPDQVVGFTDAGVASTPASRTPPLIAGNGTETEPRTVTRYFGMTSTEIPSSRTHSDEAWRCRNWPDKA